MSHKGIPRTATIIGALLLVISACGGTSEQDDFQVLPALLTTSIAPELPSAVASSLCNRVDGPGCVFDYGNFDNPTVIDNKWLPMVPGIQHHAALQLA